MNAPIIKPLAEAVQRAHAVLSPSGAAGWMVCAAKPAMERGHPDNSNKDSEYGTGAHSLATMCFAEKKPAAAYKGRRVDAGKFKTVEVDDEMVAGVQCYVDMVYARIEAYKLAGAISVELQVEQRVPIGHITGEAGAEGTADVILIVLWEDGTALIDVIDLKFGVGVKVYAENNPQGMFYALGAVEKFSIVTDFDRVRITIHQPRVSEEPSDWEIDIAQLNAFAKLASDRAADALFVLNLEGPERQDQWLVAGEHCKKTFCKARATCPKLAKFVTDSVGADFQMIDACPDVPLGVSKDPATVALKFKAIGIIEDWCKAVRARAEGLLFEHKNSPEIIAQLGIKLVEGKQGNRAWSSETEAEATMKSMRLKQDQMYDFKLISPTSAEKIAPKYDNDGKLKPNQPDTPIKPKQWTKLRTLITRSPAKPSVAPASDPRPALEIKPVADDFEVVVRTDAEDLV